MSAHCFDHSTRAMNLTECYEKSHRFPWGLSCLTVKESSLCIAGEILQGLKKPNQCSAFGTQCTPEHPLGAPMVSAEGACAAYYQYGRK